MTGPADRLRGSIRDRSTAPALALGVGLLLNAAFPPVDAGWLAPLAFAGLLVGLRGATGRRALLLGALFGAGFFGLLLHWIWTSAGVLAWVALTCLQAAFAAVAAWGIARASAERVPVVAAPLIWTSVEIARARMPLGGFTWGGAGLTQVEGPLNGYAPYGGAHLTGLMVVALGALIARWVTEPATLRRAAAIAVVIVALGAALPQGAGAQTGTIDIAAVQGNVPRDHFRIGRARQGPEDPIIVRNHIEASRSLIGSAPPDLVVWPENSFDVDPRDRPDLFDPTKAVVAQVGAPFLIGAILDKEDGFANSNLLVAPDGAIVGRYDKIHLVPFGEYVPGQVFRSLVPILDEEIPVDGIPGEDVTLFDVGGRKVGSVICFESSEQRLVRRFTAAGAQVLVVTTNNASFGTSPAAAQHLAQSRMRAIENGRAVVHAAISGISALISPDGSVGSRSELFTQQVLRDQLPLHAGITVYARWGPSVEMLMFIGGALALVMAALAERRP